MTFSHQALIFCRTACLAVMLGVFAQSALAVEVKTYGQHVGGNIVYTHQVTNTSNRNVVSIDIGFETDCVSPNLRTGCTKTNAWLIALPVGSDMFNLGIQPGSVSGPSGWTAKIQQIQDNGRFLVWRSPGYPQPSILPGQTLAFSVTVPTPDDVYLTGHFSAHHADGKEPWRVNGVMTKLDTAPPTLSVTLSPNTLKSSEKLISIVATLTVKDDYDPMPEIKLESITANEPLEMEDSKDAQIGTDDRQFKLKAEREGKNKAGRIYTVTYSATDGSGNKATASATVTVPHDERKTDD